MQTPTPTSNPTATATAPSIQAYTHIITPAQLLQLRTHSPTTLVFDCRHDLAKPDWGRAQYDAAHLPQAHFACLDRNLSGNKTGHNGRHPLPNRDALIQWLVNMGADAHTQIVCYDQLEGMFAARLWWLCRWVGLSKVAVLEGGYAAWLAIGGATDQATVSVNAKTQANSQAKTQAKTPWQMPALEAVVTTQNVLDNLQQTQFAVIDARAPERYRGEVEPLDPVAGHIPKALNHVFKRNVDGHGRFVSDLATQWQAIRSAAGHMPLVHQCGSGVTACHNILGNHVAGLTLAHEVSSLYAGSWSEWCSDSTRPVAVG